MEVLTNNRNKYALRNQSKKKNEAAKIVLNKYNTF